MTAPILSFMENGRISFKPLISAVYPLGEYRAAFERMLANDEHRIKILLDIREY